MIHFLLYENKLFPIHFPIIVNLFTFHLYKNRIINYRLIYNRQHISKKTFINQSLIQLSNQLTIVKHNLFTFCLYENKIFNQVIHIIVNSFTFHLYKNRIINYRFIYNRQYMNKILINQ